MRAEFGPDELEMIAVNMFPRYTDRAQWQHYVETQLGVKGLRYAQDSATAPLARRLNAFNSATTIVIDRQGREVYRDGRPTTYAELKGAVEAALR